MAPLPASVYGHTAGTNKGLFNMPSNILKSIVAAALVASPTIGSTQVGAEVERESSAMNDNDSAKALGALFAMAVFAVVLLVYAGQNGDDEDEDVRVSP